MGKNIKSYATTQVHFPPGKGGQPYSKRSKSLVYNMVRLNRTYYSLLKLQAKFSKLSPPVEFQRIMQIPRNSPAQSTNSAKFAHFVTLFYIMFQAPFQAENPAEFQQIMQISCNSPAQSANSAKFAHFVNLFYIMFQAPAPTENAQEFQRITQIPRSSPTQSTNYAKFAPFANIIHYVSDAWPVAENSL